MSPLRPELDVAKAAYHEIRYPGDLGAELLPRPAAGPRWWLGPLMTAAVAATVVIALRHRTPPAITAPPPQQQQQATAVVSPAATRPVRSPLFAAADIKYEVYVRDVDANVRDTMRVLTGSVDRALTAPIVTDSVRKVDEVTDDLNEIANTTWTQIRSAPKPPC